MVIIYTAGFLSSCSIRLVLCHLSFGLTIFEIINDMFEFFFINYSSFRVDDLTNFSRVFLNLFLFTGIISWLLIGRFPIWRPFPGFWLVDFRFGSPIIISWLLIGRYSAHLRFSTNQKPGFVKSTYYYLPTPTFLYKYVQNFRQISQFNLKLHAGCNTPKNFKL